MEIRPARIDDVEVLARIWHAGWIDGQLGHIADELVQHRTPESFVPRARDRVQAATVAEIDGEVVGFVVVEAPEVEQVYVDASARGTGVARVLLVAAEDAVAAAGFDTAWLAVSTGNARARRFYARNGWVDAGPVSYPAETATGTIDVDAHWYEKALVPTLRA